MDNLADGQGGNGDHVESTHAPGSQNNEGGADGEKSGPVTQQSIDKIVSKLSAQLHQYSQAAKDIKTLAEAVQTMRKDIGNLKRKSEGENDDAPASKKSRAAQPDYQQPGCSSQPDIPFPNNAVPDNHVANQLPDGIEEVSEEESDDELEQFLEPEQDPAEEVDPIDELEDYFQPDDGTGVAVGDQIARITDKAVRGPKSKKDDEKLQKLTEKHLRPRNVANLQAPKVEEFLWRQLRWDVKKVDYERQTALNSYSLAVTPITKALDALQANDSGLAKTHIMDAFKILCLTIKKTNQKRMDDIKKDLQPKFRTLVPEEPSTTKLLGDNFLEAIKKLEGTKGNVTLSQQHFLSKKGGDRNNKSSYNFKQGGQSFNKYHQKNFMKNNNNHNNKSPQINKKNHSRK